MAAAKNARNTNTAGKPAARSGPSEAAKAAEAGKPKAQVGAYTRDDAAIKVTLFIETSTHERAPVLGGDFGGERVSVFVRHSGKGSTFLSFVNKDNVQVATANAVVRKNGTPVLAARVGKGDEAATLWISLRKEVSDELLERMGVDMSKLFERETEAA